MRVVYDESCDSLGVYLDSGKEVGRFCVVENPKEERLSLQKTFTACCREAVMKERKRVKDSKAQRAK